MKGRHPRESGDPCSVWLTWIPAFAGMTLFYKPFTAFCFLLSAFFYHFPLLPHRATFRNDRGALDTGVAG